MEETRDDMIKEESEVESNLDNQNIVTDSFVEWTRSFATGTSSRTTPDSPSSETSSSTPTSPRSRQVEDCGERERGKRVQCGARKLLQHCWG